MSSDDMPRDQLSQLPVNHRRLRELDYLDSVRISLVESRVYQTSMHQSFRFYKYIGRHIKTQGSN